MSKKLNYKYYEPFEIEKPVGKQAYQQKLSKKMKIHNMLHVFLLKSYIKTNDSNILTSPAIVVKKKDEYEVKKILDSQIHQEKLQYLIK